MDKKRKLITTASNMHGCPLSRVRYCLQTHAHADHLDPYHFFLRSPEFGEVASAIGIGIGRRI